MPRYQDALAVAGDTHARFKPIKATDLHGNRKVIITDLVDTNLRRPQPIQLLLRGTLSAPYIMHNEDYNSYSMVVTLHDEDGEALTKLHEKIWTALPDQAPEERKDWETLPVFKGRGEFDYFLKLKPDPRNPKKFQVKSNLPLSPKKTSPDELFRGQAVDIHATVFAWFAPPKQQAGIGLTVGDLKFTLRPEEEDEDDDEEQDVPLRASNPGKAPHYSNHGRASKSNGKGPRSEHCD